jgi:hypothetical protein
MVSNQFQQGGGIGLDTADVMMGFTADFLGKTAPSGAFNAHLFTIRESSNSSKHSISAPTTAMTGSFVLPCFLFSPLVYLYSFSCVGPWGRGWWAKQLSYTHIAKKIIWCGCFTGRIRFSNNPKGR